MKKYFVIALVLLVSLGTTAQVRRTTVKKSVGKSVPQKSKPVMQAVEVKDSVIVFDFIADTSGVNESTSLKTRTGTTFYVVPFSKKTAHDLYNDVLVRIAHLYKSPERVTEKVEDKTIVINGYGSYINKTQRTNNNELLSVSYKLEFNFKDGKIRVNGPCFSDFETLSMSTGQEYNVSASYLWTLGQKGDTEAIKQVEQYFNKLITDLIYGNGTDEDW